jgi:hypothetical protein
MRSAQTVDCSPQPTASLRRSFSCCSSRLGKLSMVHPREQGLSCDWPSPRWAGQLKFATLFATLHITTLTNRVSSLQQAVLTGPRPHIFAAVTSSEPKAHGGEFLRRNLARELQAQIGACRGDVLAAYRCPAIQLCSLVVGYPACVRQLCKRAEILCM